MWNGEFLRGVQGMSPAYHARSCKVDPGDPNDFRGVYNAETKEFWQGEEPDREGRRQQPKRKARQEALDAPYDPLTDNEPNGESYSASLAYLFGEANPPPPAGPSRIPQRRAPERASRPTTRNLAAASFDALHYTINESDIAIDPTLVSESGSSPLSSGPYHPSATPSPAPPQNMSQGVYAHRQNMSHLPSNVPRSMGRHAPSTQNMQPQYLQSWSHGQHLHPPSHHLNHAGVPISGLSRSAGGHYSNGAYGTGSVNPADLGGNGYSGGPWIN